MALNCHGTSKGKSWSEPCGQCQPCRQIGLDNHPDILILEPVRGSLRIDQIRRLISALAIKPFSARHRIAIIADAHTMNLQAANALLKILEEPPANTTLILTAIQKADLLPTIVSRCRHIRFNPLEPVDLATLMADTQDVDEQLAETVAAMAGGSLTRARKLAATKWQHQRDWLIRAAGLDQPIRLRKRPLTLALTFSAQLSQHKDSIEELLKILQTWIRDLSIWPHKPNLVINRDLRKLLEGARRSLRNEQLQMMWQAVADAQKDIAAKANLRLTLDVMALRMAGLTEQI